MKPKEFWLDIPTRYGDPCDFISEGKPHDMPAATNIHVIEKSRFRQGHWGFEIYQSKHWPRSSLQTK